MTRIHFFLVAAVLVFHQVLLILVPYGVIYETILLES